MKRSISKSAVTLDGMEPEHKRVSTMSEAATADNRTTSLAMHHSDGCSNRSQSVSGEREVVQNAAGDNAGIETDTK